ncbi:MAG TPA: fluoride efflux transporter CrcB [Gemmatimonadaceae bacterium]|nr:fluoride efflux transporter CrcB [Gemmatimonadaceae bacterium]
MILVVALGSAIGGASRLLLGAAVQQRFGPGFPAGTLVINITGSLLLGFLMRFAMATPAISPEMRGFLTTGLCGGYTTFSTFTFETVALINDGEMGRASAYVAASVALSLLGVYLGAWAAGGLIALRQR